MHQFQQERDTALETLHPTARLRFALRVCERLRQSLLPADLRILHILEDLHAYAHRAEAVDFAPHQAFLAANVPDTDDDPRVEAALVSWAWIALLVTLEMVEESSADRAIEVSGYGISAADAVAADRLLGRHEGVLSVEMEERLSSAPGVVAEMDAQRRDWERMIG